MKKKNNKLRIAIVILFIVLFTLVSFISLRGTYLQYTELGENYVQAFWTN